MLEELMVRINKIDGAIAPIHVYAPELSSTNIPQSVTKIIPDNSASSIAKSTKARTEITWYMDCPVLPQPYVTSEGIDKASTPLSALIKLGSHDVQKKLLERWAQSNREIEEYMRQLLHSPAYIQLQELRNKINQGIDPVASSQAAASYAYHMPMANNAVTDLQTKHVDEDLEVNATSPARPRFPQSSTAELMLVLGATALGGAAFASGVMSKLPTSAVSPDISVKIVESMQHLQVLLPQIKIQDLVPIFNLMVTGPIYYHSWNNSINQFKAKERRYTEVAQNYAKDILTIVQDAEFMTAVIAWRLPEAASLSKQDLQRVATIMNVFLAASALAMLYATDVGKANGQQFGGLEPQELQALLMGELAIKDSHLSNALIATISTALADLPIVQRQMIVQHLLHYLSGAQSLNPLLNPVKVIDDVLLSAVFHESIAKKIKV